MKTALVTGGAQRIGAAISRRLAARGYRVAIHCHRSTDAADALAAEIGGGTFVVRADLSDRASVDAIVPEVVRVAGRLDVLINNASAFSYDNIETATWESFEAHLIPNLGAPLRLSQAMAALDADEDAVGDARAIVNILDEKVGNLNPDFLSYTLSKVALAGLTKTLAMAFAGRIRVNGMAPGLTLRSGKQTQESFEKAWRATPLGIGPTPEDIATAIEFILATPSLTGETLVLDGGIGLVRRARDVAFADVREDEAEDTSRL